MKEIIIWDDKYLTGIEIIDYQHKKIFKCVNTLFDALERIETKEKIIKLIDCIDFYTTTHFDTEEKYMLELDYPQYSYHKDAHETFKKIYSDIRDNYAYQNNNVYVLAIHLNNEMAKWLDYHLQNEDRLLAEFLKVNQDKIK